MMTKKKFNEHFFYWVLPVMILTPMIVMYFSGITWAKEIICPTVNWELGIPENLQLGILIMMITISILAVIRKKHPVEKGVFLFITLTGIFVFLEETDYGLHFLLYFKGQDHTLFSRLTGKANIHNIADTATRIKHALYPFMATMFILAPLVRNRIRNALIRYLVPKKFIVLTAFLTVLSFFIPKYLVDYNILPDGGFGGNIVEFSEIMIYYTFFLFLYEIIFEKNIGEEKAEPGNS